MAGESKDTLIEQWDDTRYEFISVEKLIVDKAYQRRLAEGLVREIAYDFSVPQVQVLCVSARRESGSGASRKVQEGAVFDGQHRIVGIKRRNELIKKGEVEGKRVDVVPCLVYSGLDQQKEARLFELLQLKRRNVMSYDRFRAALISGNEESLAIKELVESTGYEVGYTGMSDSTISAVAALEAAYRRDPDSLERSLIILNEAWGKKWLPQAQHIRGMARFLRDNPDIDDERLARRMFIQSPDALEEKEINARALSGGKRSDRTMADAIKAVYSMRESRVEKAKSRAA